MKVAGQRIIVFGDSLSHHGHDAAPEIWDVDQGSNRHSGQPGDLLASMLLEQGAEAVRVNARVSRSAVNFFGRENVSALLGSDQAFKPSLVIVVLGTNDLGLNPTADGQAFTKLRDFYKGLGADVWAIGPFTYNSDHLNTLAPQTIDVMRGVFGRKFIDGRLLSSQVGRSADGVHFGATAAKQTADRMLAAVLSAGPLVPTWGWVALGVTAAIGGAMFFAKRRGNKMLAGSKRDRIVKRPGESDADAQKRAFDESMGREHMPRTTIVHTPGVDYGSDPLGPDDNGVFRWRMVPSGDIVDEAELRRRLPKKLKGLDGAAFCNPNLSPEAFQRCVKRQKRALAAPIDPSDIVTQLKAKADAEREIKRLFLDPDPSSMDVIQDLALEHGIKLSKLTRKDNFHNEGVIPLETPVAARGGKVADYDRVAWSFTRDPNGYRNQCEARVNVLQDGQRVGKWGYEDGAEHFVHRYDGSDDFCQRAITAEAWAVAKEFKRKKAKGEKMTPDDIRRVMNQDNSEPSDLFGQQLGKLGTDPLAERQRVSNEIRELIRDPDPSAMDVAADLALKHEIKLSELSKGGTDDRGTFWIDHKNKDLFKQARVSWRLKRVNERHGGECKAIFDVIVDGERIGGAEREPDHQKFEEHYQGSRDFCRRAATAQAWAIAKMTKRLIVQGYRPVGADIFHTLDKDNSQPEDLFGLGHSGLGDARQVKNLMLDPDPAALDVAEDMVMVEGLKLTEISSEDFIGLDSDTIGAFKLAPGYRQLDSEWSVHPRKSGSKKASCDITLKQYVDGKMLDWTDTPMFAPGAFGPGLDRLNSTEGTIDECRRIAAEEAWNIGKEMKRSLANETDPEERQIMAMRAVERAVERTTNKQRAPKELFGLGSNRLDKDRFWERRKFRKILRDDSDGAPDIAEDYAEEHGDKITELTTYNEDGDAGGVSFRDHPPAFQWNVYKHEGKWHSEVSLADGSGGALSLKLEPSATRAEARRVAAMNAWAAGRLVRKLGSEPTQEQIETVIENELDAEVARLMRSKSNLFGLRSNKTDRDEFPEVTFRKLVSEAETVADLEVAQDYALEHALKISHADAKKTAFPGRFIKLSPYVADPVEAAKAPITGVQWEITGSKSKGWNVDFDVMLDYTVANGQRAYIQSPRELPLHGSRESVEKRAAAEAWAIAKMLKQMQTNAAHKVWGSTNKQIRLAAVKAMNEGKRTEETYPDLFGLHR